MIRLLARILLFTTFLTIQFNNLACAENSENAAEEVQFDSEKLEQYRNDVDFDYYSKNQESFQFRNKIMEYLVRFLRAVFSDKGAAPIVRYILLFAFVIFVVLKLSGGQFQWFLGSGARSQKGKVLIPEQDIHELNLLQLATDSRQNGDLRMSIRYYYLHLLKLMDASAIIQWHKDKTNRDYIREIKSDELKSQFRLQTQIFDYVWYGQFNLNEEQYLRVQSEFNKLFENIAKPRKQ